MTIVETGRNTGTSWTVCPFCDGMIYGRRYERAGRVCPDCDGHGMLTADQRIAALLDADSVRRIEPAETAADPLGFTDSRGYPERLAQARRQTGMTDAIRCAHGTIDGAPLVLAVMDFRFLGGSLGGAVGEAVTTAAEAAWARRVPLVIVTASGGARMQEGIVALMQMAKTSQALRRLDDAGVLTVSVVTDPTYGGVAASYATATDLVIAEPGARLGFAGPRVIAQTIGQTLPAGFQTAEFLLEHGFVDMICHRSALRDRLARVLALYADRRRTPRTGDIGAGGAGGAGDLGRDDTAAGESPLRLDPAALPERDAWQSVRAARELGRPTTLDYLAAAFDEFVELHGDRLAADCPAMVTALARLHGAPVVVIGTQKGHDAAELSHRNFGMPSPAGYRKSARALRLAAKLGLPVITLVDTAGAYPGITAEERGQAAAIAESLKLLAGLPVPVIAVVTGEGGSGGALALAVADRVLVCENAVYSVISPEGCAAILWKDAAAAPTAAAALRVDSTSLVRLGVADGVVPEPSGGAHRDPAAAAAALRAALRDELGSLAAVPTPDLLERRHRRFRAFGLPTSTDQEQT
ncbi:acetyl-CoA carboxylase carboxyl transferase subunit alpha [Nocardia farcinica]|uniref:acetyl-CoA carboxylase carboxyl transferase subunit alpha n=1 Tax=Nocardia farcinica TaxID=37329 RepID=UPI001896260A|nr:acetyl-CoA carboxylase carboxyl transferase subunit alpha [Nocardia farcinica]MBF6270494.1 acetyl-CoA carboxylase carboxyl transferase subunit alpha [Nocardia farcinica]MCZ9325679.1 acetyl-CoA carboxylase carboxyl transferase subunit alpha [Nocardia farcinica]